MNKKASTIIFWVLSAGLSLMMLMSAAMKISGAEQIVEGLGKAGLGSYITLFGIIELAAVVLFLIPKTMKIGFLLLCCYLGGALSIELASGQPPVAAVLLTVLWIAAFLRRRELFLTAAAKEEI